MKDERNLRPWAYVVAFLFSLAGSLQLFAASVAQSGTAVLVRGIVGVIALGVAIGLVVWAQRSRPV